MSTSAPNPFAGAGIQVATAHQTKMSIKDPLQELQRWYRSQCNEDWEHSNGVRIDTLDNPGWSLTVDLEGTDLQNKRFQELTSGVGADSYPEHEDWIVCKVDGRKFVAHGGPYKLEEMITTFLTWAKSSA
jgi:Immunity protein 53